MKGRRGPDLHLGARVLVLVDESNVVSSARTCGRNLGWLKLRDYLMDEKKARQLIGNSWDARKGDAE